MASSFLDVCRFNPTAGGTTDWTYSSAVVGYQSPTAAGAVNGAIYSYRAESADLLQWEVGFGAYNSGTGVFARTTVLFNSAGTTAKINFTAAPQVAIVALAEDIRFTPTPQGRLTLATGGPVMTTTQSAKTTIYYTPYVGNQVPIYDGTSMTMTTFPEISVATTDTTKNPAAIGASKVNDWFVWNDAGTLRLSHGPDWTSDTVRSAGTALTVVNGIYLNNAAITNGPAASRGTYVGTTRSNGSSQLDFIIGGASAGGTAAFIGLWNMYNRVKLEVLVQDTTASWNYNSTTIRNANASAANRISFVSGIGDDGVNAHYQITASGGASGDIVIGIGLDATALTTALYGSFGSSTAPFNCLYRGNPGVGFHFLQATEKQVTTASSAQLFGAVSSIQLMGLGASMRY